MISVNESWCAQSIHGHTMLRYEMFTYVTNFFYLTPLYGHVWGSPVSHFEALHVLPTTAKYNRCGAYISGE